MKKKKLTPIKIELQHTKHNPVAKFAHRVNRAEFFRDCTVYSRKGKQKNCKPFLIGFFNIVNQKGVALFFNKPITNH